MHKELQTAIAAVVRASRLTQKIFVSLQAGQATSAATVTKIDKSPVTIADYGSQAIVNGVLRSAFPKDPIVGEENAEELRKNSELRDKVWRLVSSTLEETPPDELASYGGGIKTPDDMMDLIDKGNSHGGAVGRFWTLDPIDGTLGFLRGGQYAVCLALIVDGKVEVGVLGCPNLPISSGNSERGVLLYGVKGDKAYETSLINPSMETAKVCQMKKIEDISQAKFCESVESGHSSHDQQSQIAHLLGIKTNSVRMDSQAKYAALARGDAEIYMRLPVNLDYQEKIWDHAAGQLLVELAGGRVTEMHGNPLDFGKGRTLQSHGIIASEMHAHGRVIDAVKKVIQGE